MFAPVVLTAKQDGDVGILKGYAEFWKIPYTLSRVPKTSGVVLSSGWDGDNTEGVDLIASPSGIEDAERLADALGLQVSKREDRVSLPVGPGIAVSLDTQVYSFSGPKLDPLLSHGDIVVLSRVHGTRVYLLGVDLVSEYRRLVFGGLEERPSLRFRLTTKLPLSYRLIPSFVRNRSFRSPQGIAGLTPEKIGPVECLRVVFLASLVTASSQPIPRIWFWRSGKSYAFVASHDVETEKGLREGAGRLADVERNLEIRSTWNIPTERYPLSPQSVIGLSERGELGAHDTKHDGRLLFLKFGEKVIRVKQCKDRLESISKNPIQGFRAPLLQHGQELTRAVGKAGYAFDSSVPSWEIMSPTSLRPHGVGTVFPFFLSGIVEIPVSLPQDHQLIRVGGLSASEAVDKILELSKWVCGVGAPCVLLVHPDYELAQSESVQEYVRLLERFRSDSACDIMTLGELADWWAYRARFHIDTSSGHPELISESVNENVLGDLELQLVTGYSSDGFKIESFSPALKDLGGKRPRGNSGRVGATSG